MDSPPRLQKSAASYGTQRFEKMPERFFSCGKHTYVTGEGGIEITADDSSRWSALEIIRYLTELRMQEVDVHSAKWFYYTHDWSCDADELHVFFIVHNGKIVCENSSFGHSDPLVLKKYHRMTNLFDQ